MGDSPGCYLGDTIHYLNQAGERLSHDMPAEFTRNQKTANAKLEKLREQVKSLAAVRRAYEQIDDVERQLADVRKSLQAMDNVDSTKAKLHQAEVISSSQNSISIHALCYLTSVSAARR